MYRLEFIGLYFLGLLCLSPLIVLESYIFKSNIPIVSLFIGWLIFVQSNEFLDDSLISLFVSPFAFLWLGLPTIGQIALDFIT